VQQQLLVAQRAAQRRLHLHAVRAPLRQLRENRRKPLRPSSFAWYIAASAFLSSVSASSPSSGIEREPEAAAHVDLVALDLEGRRTSSRILARDALGRVLVGQVLEHHHELVAGDAREHVALAQRRADARARLLQQQVAHAVAERVVHVLEVVEVEEHHAHAALRAVRARRARARGGRSAARCWAAP
jgi:hypothetical protein